MIKKLVLLNSCLLVWVIVAGLYGCAPTKTAETVDTTIDSMVVLLNDQSPMLSVSIGSIRKIRVDPFFLIVDTGVNVQRPIGATSTTGPISIIFKSK